MRDAARRALSGLAGRHWIVTLAALESFRAGLLIVGLPVKLNRLGWTDIELGLFAGLGAAVYALSCVLYGRVVHRAPLRLLMNVSAWLCVGLSVALAMVDSKAALFVLGAVHALAISFFWPSLMAWIGESHDDHLVGDMAAFNGSWTLAVTLGFLAGGQIEQARPGLALYAVAGVVLVLALLIPFAHIRGGMGSREAAAVPPEAVILPRRFLAAGWVAAFLVTLSAAVPEAIFVKLNADLGYSASDYGLFFTVRGAVQAAVVLGLGVFRGWRYRRWPLVACLVASAAGGGLLAVAQGRGMFLVGFGLLGAGMGAGYSLGFFYSIHGRRDRKRNAGFFEALISSQSIVGGPLGGWLAAARDRRTPYAAMAAAACLAALAQVVLLWRAPARMREMSAQRAARRGSGSEL